MDLQSALSESIAYLASYEAETDIKRDPYWPKWNTPWWHMSLLRELGRPDLIPAVAIEAMVQALKTHYIPIFPLRIEEIPKGMDPYRHILCFCAVGNMYQVLFAAGVDVDQELPWMKDWFFKYQIADGGLNCDERVYTKANPKSSIMSTVPCLEAVLYCRNGELTPQEEAFVQKGAEYLVKQKLFRKVSTGEVIDQDWLEACFPRFYSYDFLRGYYFLAKWSEYSGFKVPNEIHDEVKALIAKQETPAGIILKRYNSYEKKSYNPMPDGTWKMGDISEFSLMKAVSHPGAVCAPLTKEWNEAKTIFCVR